MLKLDVLAAELNLWANETEQIYRATKEIKYRSDAKHLRYLAATLNQSSLPSTGVTSFNTRVGNVVLLSSDVTTALGYIPVTQTRTLTINGVTQDLSNDRSWTISTTTPTLNAVTTAGNTTTNAITVGSFTSKSGVNNVVNTGNHTAQGYTFRVWDTTNGYTLDLNGTGSITHQQKLIFGIGNATSYSEAMRIPSTGNVLIGTTTDAGYKLDVNGTLRTVNDITTNSTFIATSTSLSGSTKYFSLIRSTDNWNPFYVTSDRVLMHGVLFQLNGQGGGIINSANSVGGASTYITLSGPQFYNSTSGVASTFAVTGESRMSSGTATFNTLTVAPTINNTGTYSGIFRGLYYNPTLTSLTGTTHRAIETTSGDVLFGNNFFWDNTGFLGIGTSTPNTPPTYNGITINSAGAGAYIWFQNAGVNKYSLGSEGNINYHNLAAGTSFSIRSGGTYYFSLVQSTGNVQIGATTDAGYKLDINGSVRIGSSTFGYGGDLVTLTSNVGTSALRVGGGNTLYVSGQLAAANLQATDYVLVTRVLVGNGTARLTATTTDWLSITDSGQTANGSGNLSAKFATFGTTYATINASAQVEIASTTRGFLQPRMTNAQAVAISSPATGLQVYDTTNNKNLLYNGTTWQNIAIETWLTSGSNIYYNTGNVGIGTSSPTNKIHIVDSTSANIFGRIDATGTNASAAWVAGNDQGDNIVYRVFGSAVTGSQMGISLVRSASLMANLGGSGKFLVGTYSSTDFVMGTGNQERMRLVDLTGNFLIGTNVDSGYKLNVSGDIRSTSHVIADGNLKSNYQAGDEGGEITLNKPATGTTIDTSITIDVYQNKLRIFESGGLNRGGYFNISALANGVGTNFSPAGWTGTINITTMPPISIQVVNGIITNVI